jgi:DNA-binding Lrp family transcriptional regulator
LGRCRSQNRVLTILGDGKPKSTRDIARMIGLSDGATGNALKRLWVRGLIMRTKLPIFEEERVFKGRAGLSRTTRPYHLYLIRVGGQDEAKIDGYEFVKYSKKYLDARGGGKRSKAKIILEFLEKNRDKAWFSTEVVANLRQ